MSRKYDHKHHYKKVNLSKKQVPFFVFKCVKEGCTHYMREDMIVGAKAECPRCGEEYTFDKNMLELTEPHCNNCKIAKDIPA